MKEIFCLITDGEKNTSEILSTGKYDLDNLRAMSGGDSPRDYFLKKEVFLKTYFP